VAGRHKDHAAERALACYHLGLGGTILVATPSALAAPLLSPAAFRTREFSLEVGRTIDRDTLIQRLDAAGYERVDTVVEVGQWSLRGGIVDVFSPMRERPCGRSSSATTSNRCASSTPRPSAPSRPSTRSWCCP
jgi:Transcription-repair coupling factor (superfamily II helicase)